MTQKNHIKRFLATITLIASMSILSVYGQTDANICHFWSDRSFFNPAYIVPATLHGSLVARSQQIGFDGQPMTAAGNFSLYKPKWRSLIGAQLRYDYAGYTTTAKADLQYAFSLGSEDDRVNFGLSAGTSYKNYDERKIKADEMSDAFLYDYENAFKPNYNFGIEWIHKVNRFSSDQDEFTLGASMLNMEDYFSRYENRITVNEFYAYSSYRLRTVHNLDFYMGGMGQYYDTNRLQGEIHGSIIKTGRDRGDLDVIDIWALGLSYRHNAIGRGSSDMIVNAGIAIGPHIYVGYSFDMVVRNDFGKPFSSHEIFFEYKFKDRDCLADKSNYVLLGGK